MSRLTGADTLRLQPGFCRWELGINTKTERGAAVSMCIHTRARPRTHTHTGACTRTHKDTHRHRCTHSASLFFSPIAVSEKESETNKNAAQCFPSIRKTSARPDGSANHRRREVMSFSFVWQQNTYYFSEPGDLAVFP